MERILAEKELEHGVFIVPARSPVGIGHSEVIEVSEQRRHSVGHSAPWLGTWISRHRRHVRLTKCSLTSGQSLIPRLRPETQSTRSSVVCLRAKCHSIPIATGKAGAKLTMFGSQNVPGTFFVVTGNVCLVVPCFYLACDFFCFVLGFFWGFFWLQERSHNVLLTFVKPEPLENF